MKIRYSFHIHVHSADCDVLPALLHGTVSYSSGRTTYKEIATFTCDVGYNLSHKQTRTCDDLGKWTGTTPVCIIQGNLAIFL